MFQKIIIIGNLGRDPEMRYTAQGNPITRLNIATNRRWNDAQGQSQEETTWFRVTVFGKQAEACNQYLNKGRQVLVEGRIRTGQYEDKNGVTRYTWEIIAQTVRFLGGRGEGGGASSDMDMPPMGDEEEIPF